MLLPTIRILAVWLFCSIPCLAVQVQVAVVTSSGKPLQGALVIVQDLQHGDRELFRSLTDQDGVISARTLDRGLYRAIATYPYSQWQTAVQEFLVRDQPVKVTLRLSRAESLDNTMVSIGRLTVHVLNANGLPAEGARVLVRDADANPSSEHWGTTNEQGTTTLDLTLNPAVLVVVYQDKLYFFPTSGLDTERTLRLK